MRWDWFRGQLAVEFRKKGCFLWLDAAAVHRAATGFGHPPALGS